MKKTLYLLGFIALITSCQKVIDVDLNDANPVPVLEANYFANDSTLRLQANFTSNYFGSDAPQSIDNALVTIVDQFGAMTTVPFMSNGYYELSGYAPQFNTTYTLSLTHNGTTYTSSCFLPDTITQLEPTYDFLPNGFFGSGPGYFLNLRYDDPAGLGDHTMAIYTYNDTVAFGVGEYMLNDDQLIDGNTLERPFPGRFFLQGDSVVIDLRTIDPKVSEYYEQLTALSDPNSAAPANPDVLWTNDALGYFNCYGSSYRTILLP